MGGTRKSWLVLGLALALTLAACSGGAPEETAIQAAGAQTAADPYAGRAAADPYAAQPAQDSAVAQHQLRARRGGCRRLGLGECGELGECVTNAEGKVAYGFTDDTQNAGTSACEAACLANWPAWVTEGAPQAGEGIDPARVSTLTGTDSTTQVAYNGWPLYFYAGDPGPGSCNGQDVGQKWYVLNAAGQLVKEPATGCEAADSEAADSDAADSEAPVLEGQDAVDAYSGTDTVYGGAPAADDAPAASAPAATQGELPDSQDVTLESGRSDPAYGGWYLRTGNNYTLYTRDPARPCSQYDCSGYQRVTGAADVEDGVAQGLVGVSPEGWTTCDGRPVWRRISEGPLEITGRPFWQLVDPDTCEGFVGQEGWDDEDDEDEGFAPAAPAAPSAGASSSYGSSTGNGY